jgi:ArsR family transcriptional regulator, arsenate/arsenite/antimonite-responsive transcriptional repressor
MMATATNSKPGVRDLDDDAIRDMASTLKLLSDPTRLRITLYLAQDGEMHVSAICDRLRQNQPAVSHHLALLRVSGMVVVRREGKFNCYSLRAGLFQTYVAGLLDNVA